MGHRPDIVNRLRARYPQLPNSERKLADVVLGDLAFAAHASLDSLARRAGVGGASVTRFARRLDCRDVRDLKLQLAQSLAVGERFIEDRDRAVGPSGVHAAIEATLRLNASLLDPEAITAAARRLGESRQVLVFGVGGGSTALAMECQFRLFRFGIAATAYSDPMLMRMAAATLEAQDTVLCLSLSGHGDDVVEAASIAREYAAHCIAITPGGSPLAAAADRLLPIELHETDDIYTPSTGRFAMLAMIDVLVTELAQAHPQRSREMLRRLKHHLDAHRGGGDRQPLGD